MTTRRLLLPTVAALAACLSCAPAAFSQQSPAVNPSAIPCAGQPAGDPGCDRTISRKLFLAKARCPDDRAAKACRSFKELVRVSDPDLMDELAHRDHVFVCFVNNKDEFFEASFSDPVWTGFRKPSLEQVKDGAPENAMIVPGSSQFIDYKSGVADADGSYHNSGYWIQLSAETTNSDPSVIGRQARFQAKNIQISPDQWKLTETYRNEAGSETRHEVTIQLASGRFSQLFSDKDSGTVLNESSGRCIIVSPAD